ncbi:MAG: heme ABC transporter ATP-binding protein [Immundisolibacteraceae bacterium]|nr:heme ABC transporter ATP-binding protein [Immundisolibacteraceae bacterium]
MLTATDISVDLRSTRILERVSVNVEQGEVLAILGPNGAGKSTLLAVLSGTRHPNTGTVTLHQKPLTNWPARALARQRAVLSQQPELNFPFRVLEVVMLGRSPHAGQSSRDQDLSICHAALEETATTHLADRIYTTLSGGERQRIQLARVLVQLDFTAPPKPANSRLLLLDEPTAALDLTHQHAVLSTAKRLADQGFGVVTILHDPNLAARYADQIVLLHQGRLLHQGTPHQVLTESAIQQIYGLPVTIARHPIHHCPQVIAL